MNESEASDFVSRKKGAAKFARFWLPYLFQKVEHPGHKWAYLPLNRNYKPIGYLGSDWVEYEAYVISHGVYFDRDPALLKGTWWNQDLERPDMLWLYEVAAKSRLDYFSRLERVMLKAKLIATRHNH